MPAKTRFSRIEARGQGHSDMKTVRDLRCIHTPNPKIILEMCSVHDFSRIEARGQVHSHSDPKIVCDPPGPQGVSTH